VFHDPEDYPDAGLQMALVEPGRLVTVMLEAQLVESVSDVRWISVQNRQCWFDDEVAVVQSSRSYSYQNCLTECRMKAFQDKCGCIPFFYPLFSQYLPLNYIIYKADQFQSKCSKTALCYLSFLAIRSKPIIFSSCILVTYFRG
jgi:hypothetical protein